MNSFEYQFENGQKYWQKFIYKLGLNAREVYSDKYRAICIFSVTLLKLPNRFTRFFKYVFCLKQDSYHYV